MQVSNVKQNKTVFTKLGTCEMNFINNKLISLHFSESFKTANAEWSSVSEGISFQTIAINPEEKKEKNHSSLYSVRWIYDSPQLVFILFIFYLHHNSDPMSQPTLRSYSASQDSEEGVSISLQSFIYNQKEKFGRGNSRKAVTCQAKSQAKSWE